LEFQIQYPDIEEGVLPKHRLMSPFEQKIDLPPDKKYQYLIFAAEPYETISFKIPNLPIDKSEDKFTLNWEKEKKILALTIYFIDKDNTLQKPLPPKPIINENKNIENIENDENKDE
jgi:splicing factor 3A subunit 2